MAPPLDPSPTTLRSSPAPESRSCTHAWGRTANPRRPRLCNACAGGHERRGPRDRARCAARGPGPR
eukprot:6979871-Lingulodinium_polyedra.AAC.1